MNVMDVWQRTATGKVFYPFAPGQSPIFLEDIVRNLARSPRYNGGIKWPSHYSVAEHSVLLARYVLETYPKRPMLALQALMHDAAEAYIGDMIRPIKEVMPLFSELDDQITEAIFENFGIDYPFDPIIKQIDTRILLDEEAQVLEPGDRPFNYPGATPLGIKCHCWEAEAAYKEFFLTWIAIWQQIQDRSFRQAVG